MLLYYSIFISAIVGGCVLLLMFIVRKLKNSNITNKNVTKTVSDCSRKDKQTKSSKRKTIDNKWVTQQTSKHSNYSHPWLLTSLKGHTGSVLAMDLSSNGKYLVSCAEEFMTIGHEDDEAELAIVDENPPHLELTPDCDTSSNSSNSSSPIARSGLSRRQRKNKKREDRSVVETLKKKTKMKASTAELINVNSRDFTPLKQYTKLQLNDLQLYAFMGNYLLSADQRFTLGYPVESELHPELAIIFKSASLFLNTTYSKQSRFDVNAREFVPGSVYDSSSDTSDDSSLDSTDSLPWNEERQCVRCGRAFHVTQDSKYLMRERCMYHWGKLRDIYTGPASTPEYSCCNGHPGASGCTRAKLHVWHGLHTGFNGPFKDYVRTKPSKDGKLDVYAIDCEMCFTTDGLELTKITVVGIDGRLVYDAYVRPDNDIIDYNTRFSGITAKLFKESKPKTLQSVQCDLLSFISAETILVGHGLENDLRAMRILHDNVVDTAIAFPHYQGLPYRRSLKTLVCSYLKRDIQCSASGHNSCEDALAAMELMLWRIRNDFRTILCQYRR